MREGQQGFMFLELLIVILVIAIIASIAIPNLLSARLTSNESAAISTLRSISSAQAEVQTSRAIDANGNGVGEYAFFAELASGVGLREASGTAGARFLTPPTLSATFANVTSLPPITGGVVTRSGYVFQIFLPHATGTGLVEATAGGVGSTAPDPVQSELLWCCYAWPMDFGNTGRRAFFVNQWGEILSTRNTIRRYSGATNAPDFSVAFAAGTGNLISGTIAANATGRDGQFWLAIN